MNSLCDWHRFGLQKSKERTSRITLWRLLGIPNIFTLESSFLGSDNGQYAGLHFTNRELMQTGRDVCRALVYCFDLNQPKPLPSLTPAKEQDLKPKHRPSPAPKFATNLYIRFTYVSAMKTKTQ